MSGAERSEKRRKRASLFPQQQAAVREKDVQRKRQAVAAKLSDVGIPSDGSSFGAAAAVQGRAIGEGVFEQSFSFDNFHNFCDFYTHSVHRPP